MIKKLEKALEKAFIDLGYEGFNRVSVSNRPELCDFQINSVFEIAKKESKNPIEVGELITNKINQMNNFSDYFNKVEFVKPGFINLTISDTFISNCLNELIESKTYGINKIKENQTIVTSIPRHLHLPSNRI